MSKWPMACFRLSTRKRKKKKALDYGDVYVYAGFTWVEYERCLWERSVLEARVKQMENEKKVQLVSAKQLEKGVRAFIKKIDQEDLTRWTRDDAVKNFVLAFYANSDEFIQRVTKSATSPRIVIKASQFVANTESDLEKKIVLQKFAGVLKEVLKEMGLQVGEAGDALVLAE